jgi:hypothetical protein
VTESEWETSQQPEEMLKFLKGKAGDRKFRLFLIACSRRVLPSDADTDMIEALAVAERFADGKATKRELTHARTVLHGQHMYRSKKWPLLYSSHIRSVPAWHSTREHMGKAASQGSQSCAWSSARLLLAGIMAMTYPGKEFEAQSNLIRDLFGNPFRPIALDPSWLTSTATALARLMYDSRDFSAMPILADALQDAGCDNADILDHCRGPGPHVRGCWVVDKLLSRE